MAGAARGLVAEASHVAIDRPGGCADDFLMNVLARPFLVAYVAWHPKFTGGERIAKALFEHYHRAPYENASGGTGFGVVYRSKRAPGSQLPLDVDFEEAETTAVILLVDRHWAKDPAWVGWARDLASRAEQSGLRAVVFPIAVDGSFLELGLSEQAVRWDQWTTTKRPERVRRLISTLSYQFCSMLRLYLERLKRPQEDEEALENFLRRVQVFLSHSKHDEDGADIAKLIRGHLFHGIGGTLSTFFDVHDIPAGVPFDKVLLHKLRVSAVVAIHTDSYSSREWCRREIIEAKRWSVPLVVANCISDLDERSFPYMGNVPLVRLDPKRPTARVDYVVGLLLDEVLKDFLWRCRVELSRAEAGPDTLFLPRPPELIALARLREQVPDEGLLVYPDPPLGEEERRLFEAVAPTVRLRSMTQWLSELPA